MSNLQNLLAKLKNKNNQVIKEEPEKNEELPSIDYNDQNSAFNEENNVSNVMNNNVLVNVDDSLFKNSDIKKDDFFQNHEEVHSFRPNNIVSQNFKNNVRESTNTRQTEENIVNNSLAAYNNSLTNFDNFKEVDLNTNNNNNHGVRESIANYKSNDSEFNFHNKQDEVKFNDDLVNLFKKEKEEVKVNSQNNNLNNPAFVAHVVKDNVKKNNVNDSFDVEEIFEIPQNTKENVKEMNTNFQNQAIDQSNKHGFQNLHNDVEHFNSNTNNFFENKAKNNFFSDNIQSTSDPIQIRSTIDEKQVRNQNDFNSNKNDMKNVKNEEYDLKSIPSNIDVFNNLNKIKQQGSKNEQFDDIVKSIEKKNSVQKENLDKEILEKKQRIASEYQNKINTSSRIITDEGNNNPNNNNFFSNNNFYDSEPKNIGKNLII